MKYLFAPMEGITKYPFRRVHHEMFPGTDLYYMPFIVANQTMHFKKKELNDISQDNNRGVPAVPQVLTNKPDQFLHAVRLLVESGYEEINLNLGCPMATEVTKKKGAGFLSVPDELDRFFEEVFRCLDKEGVLAGPAENGGLQGKAGTGIRISVKTRTGVESASESVRLMEIFNRYPIGRLIIHARRRVDFYKGMPDLDTFGEMFAASAHPVSYNGDLFAPEDLVRLRERFPALDSVMIGRGLIANPALVREMKGGGKLTKEELQRYLEKLLEVYREVIHEEINVVHKMKELWYYLGNNFPDGRKQLKKISKARSAAEYSAAVEELLHG